MDVACPFDTRMAEKERKKVDQYHELKYEWKRIWSCGEMTVILALIGALGTISKEFHNWTYKINPNIFFGNLQKACRLETARIIRDALNI